MRKLRERLSFESLRLRYFLWDRWRYGSLLDGPLGEHVKVQFRITEPDGPSSEGLWSERIERGCFKLLNNGLFIRAAAGDIVRARVRWPFVDVVEVVERARSTWALNFQLVPSEEERQLISQAILNRGGTPEWWHEEILSVAVQLVDDAAEVCRDVLGPGVELVPPED